MRDAAGLVGAWGLITSSPIHSAPLSPWGGVGFFCLEKWPLSLSGPSVSKGSLFRDMKERIFILFFKLPSTSLWSVYSVNVHPFNTVHPLSHSFSVIGYIDLLATRNVMKKLRRPPFSFSFSVFPYSYRHGGLVVKASAS